MADTILSNVTTEQIFRTIDTNLVLYIAVIIVVTYLLTYLLSFILVRVSERVGGYRTSITMVIPLLKITIYAIALYFINGALIEPSLTQMVAFSGLFGAAIGFGLKDLKEALVTSKYVIISQKYPYTVLVEGFPFYTRIRGKGYVYDLRQEFEFKSEVTRRTMIEFQRSGIRPPVYVPGVDGVKV